MSLQEITNQLNKWYFTEIKSLAMSALHEWYDMERDCMNEHGLEDWLHETIDGHEFVIYTYKAQLAVATSSHDDAWEDMGLENPTYEQKAYCAMIADVREYLDNEYLVAEFKEEYYANESEHAKRERFRRAKAEYLAENVEA